MNRARHLVSVVLPVFNGGEFLQAALGSVTAQTYPNLELITVDDGSTDGSERVLQSFSRSCPVEMKVLSHPDRERRGIAASYRLALQHCRGDLIAFLEQDDYWTQNKVSEQIGVFDEFPEVGVVFSDVYVCDETGRVADRPFKGLVNRPPRDRPFSSFGRLMWGNYVLTFSNIMVRRGLVRQDDLIAEPEGFQDWMLLLRLASRCRFYHCGRTRMYWRRWSDNFHGRLRQSPDYLSWFGQSRKRAWISVVEQLLAEREAGGHRWLPDRVVRFTWYTAISLLGVTKRVCWVLERSRDERVLPSAG